MLKKYITLSIVAGFGFAFFFIFLGIQVADVSGAPTIGLNATIDVTTTADEYNEGGACSLREAVTAANTNSAFGGCPAGSGVTDTIQLPSGVYTLTIAGAGENLNVSGDLDVGSDLIISGSSALDTIINANGIDRALDVHSIMYPTNLTLIGVAITNGQAPHGAAGQPGADGGGIRSTGPLTLENCDVHHNRAGDAGDGSSHGGQGGGIYAEFELDIIDSTVRYNDAGVGGTVASGDAGDGGDGGGVYAGGNAQIIHSRIERNHAGSGGDASWIDVAVNAGHGGDGGGIYADANLSVIGSYINYSYAGHGGDGEFGHQSYAGGGGRGGGIYGAL